MIVVKLKQTLRVFSDKVGKHLIPIGSVFRANKYEDFPKWLREEIKHFNKTLTCDTLLIKEMSVNVRKTASKGKKSDKSKVKEKKVEKKVLVPKDPHPEVPKIKDAPKDEQPIIILHKRKK